MNFLSFYGRSEARGKILKFETSSLALHIDHLDIQLLFHFLFFSFFFFPFQVCPMSWRGFGTSIPTSKEKYFAKSDPTSQSCKCIWFYIKLSHTCMHGMHFIFYVLEVRTSQYQCKNLLRDTSWVRLCCNMDQVEKKYVFFHKKALKDKKNSVFLLTGIHSRNETKWRRQYIHCLLYTSPSPRDQA